MLFVVVSALPVAVSAGMTAALRWVATRATVWAYSTYLAAVAVAMALSGTRSSWPYYAAPLAAAAAAGAATGLYGTCRRRPHR